MPGAAENGAVKLAAGGEPEVTDYAVAARELRRKLDTIHDDVAAHVARQKEHHAARRGPP